MSGPVHDKENAFPPANIDWAQLIPLLGSVMAAVAHYDGTSSAIPKMRRVMAGNGSPPPEFDFDEEHSYFMVRLPVHPSLGRAESGAESLDRQIATTLLYGARLKAKISTQLGRQITGAFNRRVRELLENEWIAYTIPDKPKSRLQKYQLTELGRSGLLKQEAD